MNFHSDRPFHVKFHEKWCWLCGWEPCCPCSSSRSDEIKGATPLFSQRAQEVSEPQPQENAQQKFLLGKGPQAVRQLQRVSVGTPVGLGRRWVTLLMEAVNFGRKTSSSPHSMLINVGLWNASQCFLFHDMCNFWKWKDNMYWRKIQTRWEIFKKWNAPE